MREIKFRAWWYDHNTGKNKMIYGGLEDFIMWKDEYREEWVSLIEEGFPDDPDVPWVMQYTGLKDKNGKEIYEGDILGVSGGSGVFWEVSWDNTKTDLPVGFVFGSFGMRSNIPQYLHPSIDRLEIIGNIYENPELLNGDT